MPISKYFDGHGDEVMADMKKRYGDKEGERVFYATANKRGETAESVNLKRVKKALTEDVSTKSSAGYLGPEHGPFRCGNCEHFNGADACEVVSGLINKDGCCNLFVKK